MLRKGAVEGNYMERVGGGVLFFFASFQSVGEIYSRMVVVNMIISALNFIV